MWRRLTPRAVFARADRLQWFEARCGHLEALLSPPPALIAATRRSAGAALLIIGRLARDGQLSAAGAAALKESLLDVVEAGERLAGMLPLGSLGPASPPPAGEEGAAGAVEDAALEVDWALEPALARLRARYRRPVASSREQRARHYRCVRDTHVCVSRLGRHSTYANPYA